MAELLSIQVIPREVKILDREVPRRTLFLLFVVLPCRYPVSRVYALYFYVFDGPELENFKLRGILQGSSRCRQNLAWSNHHRRGKNSQNRISTGCPIEQSHVSEPATAGNLTKPDLNRLAIDVSQRQPSTGWPIENSQINEPARLEILQTEPPRVGELKDPTEPTLGPSN